MKHKILVVMTLLCVVMQGSWAQELTPSTELEPYITTLDDRMVYKFNYPSTSVTGEPVVLSSLLCCWAPATPPEEDAGIESVHLYSHYTVTANSQCPTSATLSTADFIVLAALFEGAAYDEEKPYKSIVKRSIVIMPDYEGYGVSSARTHPYLIQKVTAQQVVDALTYGLELYDKLDGADNTLLLEDDWRCFSLGYSQGGAVALAVQRHIEQNGLSDKLHFRGTICGDGPYDLMATMRYYLDDDGTSYDVTTAHGEDEITFPVVLPMIMNGMIVGNSAMSQHKLNDYFAQSFLDTGVMDWLSTKTITSDDINKAWLSQIDNGKATVGGKDYPAPANMSEMFFKHEIPGLIWSSWVAWANLDKILTQGFYSYMKNPDNFISAPAMTGDAYEDMRYALVSNNVCTGWEPQHRIQFTHSKGDMVVPYGNYLAFHDAHPNGLDDMYRIDNVFSKGDHLDAGTLFLGGLGTGFFDYFQWIDTATPTGIKTVADVRGQLYDVWYTIDGRRLSGKPTARGLYIVNGNKVVIK
jgi:hypothetical protein